MTESRLDRGLNAAAGKGRSAAAEVSRDFAVVEDLATLLGVAEYGFTVLFDGYATIQLGVGADARFVSGGTSWRREQLAGSVAAGLAGTPSPDVVSRRPGILLVPQSAIGECRAWVQFPPAETHQRAGDDRRGPFRAGLRDRGRPADRHGPGGAAGGAPEPGNGGPPDHRGGRWHPGGAAPDPFTRGFRTTQGGKPAPQHQATRNRHPGHPNRTGTRPRLILPTILA